MAETVKTRVRVKKDKCDNHPEIDAELVTNGDGAHAVIRLCVICVTRLRRVR